jgi:hypothetical protein
MARSPEFPGGQDDDMAERNQVETYRNQKEHMATQPAPEPGVVMLDIIRKLDELDDDDEIERIMRALVEYYSITIRSDRNRSEEE